MPLRFIYPECFVLIDKHENVHPMQCFNTVCPANKMCAETIAHRVHYLYDNVLPKEVTLLIAYFKYRDRPNSVRGTLFWRSMAEPKTIILNRSGLKKCQDEGTLYTWNQTTEFTFIGASNKIIPAETLTKWKNLQHKS